MKPIVNINKIEILNKKYLTQITFCVFFNTGPLNQYNLQNFVVVYNKIFRRKNK